MPLFSSLLSETWIYLGVEWQILSTKSSTQEALDACADVLCLIAVCPTVGGHYLHPWMCEQTRGHGLFILESQSCEASC